MTASDPLPILTGLGIEDVVDCSPLPSGMGGTLLWKVTRDTAPQQLVLRVFPGGHDHLAAREAAAHRIAIAGGVPAPQVIASGRPVLRGQRGDDVAIVMTWSPGRQAAEELLASPDQAYAIGESCGRTLGALHRIRPPGKANAALGPDASWLTWSRGEHTERVRELWSTTPFDRMRERPVLLHLDFHPENVLLDGREVSGVLDWANARWGPPEADLARSSAIMWLIPHHPRIPSEARPALADYAAGLRAGHRTAYGPTSDAPLFTAWALSAQWADLERKVGTEGFWVSPATLEELRDEAERAFARAESRSGA